MKRIIIILSSLCLTTSAALAVVSCGDNNNEKKPLSKKDFKLIETQNVVAGKTIAVTISPKATDPNLTSIIASSSNKDKATVTVNGLKATIKGIKEGSSTITVSADGYNNIEFIVTVTPSPKKDFNSITSQSVIFGETTDVTISPNVADPNLTSISAASTDENIATVSVNGLKITIKGVKEGTSTIAVSADGYNNIEFIVTVKPVPKKIKIDVVQNNPEIKNIKDYSSLEKLNEKLKSIKITGFSQIVATINTTNPNFKLVNANLTCSPDSGYVIDGKDNFILDDALDLIDISSETYKSYVKYLIDINKQTDKIPANEAPDFFKAISSLIKFTIPDIVDGVSIDFANDLKTDVRIKIKTLTGSTFDKTKNTLEIIEKNIVEPAES